MISASIDSWSTTGFVHVLEHSVIHVPIHCFALQARVMAVHCQFYLALTLHDSCTCQLFAVQTRAVVGNRQFVHIISTARSMNPSTVCCAGESCGSLLPIPHSTNAAWCMYLPTVCRACESGGGSATTLQQDKHARQRKWHALQALLTAYFVPLKSNASNSESHLEPFQKNGMIKRFIRFSVALHPQKPSGVLGTGSPGRSLRLSHSSWALPAECCAEVQ